ncbi:MAG: long-chain fatty acid--CoA ligase [Bdellovibrionales bacterium CG10_big_fil_rev_8_21_14_0_10_45_34]|nr:MAG: long-chain fatty acid--CoA ligase [Bdellovibrionales bacterium CG10_big_fil_rev_8_21_14_0_10_45_34]
MKAQQTRIDGEEQTLLYCLRAAYKRTLNSPAARYKNGKTWEIVSWPEYIEAISRFANELKNMGAKKGDRIALFANTGIGWGIADFAVLSIGGISVPVYPNASEVEIEHLVKDARPKVILCENDSFIKKLPSVGIDVKVALLNTQIEKSSKMDPGELEAFFQEAESHSISDIATIVYTSGTSGTQKGVVLTHEQVKSEVVDVFDIIPIEPTDDSLTFLPFAHVLGRVELWGHMYRGFTMNFAESIEKIRYNIKEIKPTFLIAVPRIFEKLFAAIQTQATRSDISEKAFNWSRKVAINVAAYRVERTPVPLIDLAQYQIAKKLVFSKVSEQLGGRLRMAFSGGAPLAEEIGRFFYSVGITIVEGYGLTETTAAIFANTPYEFRFGTVGMPVGDVKFRLDSDGEILVKSKKIMKEYWNLQDDTKAAFTEDGYFKTGDIGEVVSEKFLRITDRKKDLIKTSGGKYVAPQKLENLIKLSPLVSNVLIHGDRRKYIVALITLQKENVKSKLENNGEAKKLQEEVFHSHPMVDKWLREHIRDVNLSLASYESIKNFRILAEDFSVESGELTPSLKVKRRIADKRYQAELDSLYQ